MAAEAASPFVLSSVEGAVGWLTLNEPARLNPVNGERITEINTAAAAMSARDDVAVVVITGAGRAFCAGADINAKRYDGSARTDPLRRPTPPASNTLSERPGLWTLTSMRQPVIAMLNGATVGYGFELALQADIRIAAETARIGAPFPQMGTVSDTGAATWLLPRLVGWSRAAEILYSGRLLPAAEAAAIGLVNSVHPAQSLHAVVSRTAAELAGGSAWSLRTLKRMLFDGLAEFPREHVLSQWFRFNTGDPGFDRQAYLEKVRSRQDS